MRHLHKHSIILFKVGFQIFDWCRATIKVIEERECTDLHSCFIYMYEYDDIVKQEANLYEQRISSYMTCTFSILKNVELTSTIFYQPNIENVADYRIANDSGLEIHINKHLNFKSSFNMLYDTYQPIGIPDLVYSFKNGLTLKF